MKNWKTTVFLTAAIFMASALSMTACDKEEAQKPTEQNEVTERSRTGEFENPYEWVGVEHNNLLQHLIDIDSYEYDDGVAYASVALGLPVEEFLPYSEVEADLELILDPEVDYIATLGFDTPVMDVFDQIFDILETGTDIEAEYDALAETTYNSESFSTYDQQLLLGSIALAKHSSAFWTAYGGPLPIEACGPCADIAGFVKGFHSSAFHSAFQNGIASGGVASRVANR